MGIYGFPYTTVKRQHQGDEAAGQCGGRGAGDRYMCARRKWGGRAPGLYPTLLCLPAFPAFHVSLPPTPRPPPPPLRVCPSSPSPHSSRLSVCSHLQLRRSLVAKIKTLRKLLRLFQNLDVQRDVQRDVRWGVCGTYVGCVGRMGRVGGVDVWRGVGSWE